MSVLILGQDFRPTWDKLTPYINRDSTCDPQKQQKLLQTAQKALYAFLNRVVNGLTLHLNALDDEYGVNMQTKEKPYSEHINTCMKNSLNGIRGSIKAQTVVDINLVSQEVSKLKQEAEKLMQLEVAYEWKFWRVLCCFG